LKLSDITYIQRIASQVSCIYQYVALHLCRLLALKQQTGVGGTLGSGPVLCAKWQRMYLGTMYALHFCLTFGKEHNS